MYKCVYTENDIIVENDKVSENDAIEWFRDSYNFHSGEYPNDDEINVFNRGEYVDYIPNDSTCCSWKMYKIGE